MAGRSVLLGGVAIWMSAIPVARAQQTLAFTEPAATALTALGDVMSYRSGESVQIAWTTPYDFTTLVVYQGPLDNGFYNEETIAANLGSAETSTTWTASVIDGASNASALYFQLQNADDATCDGCSVNSVRFYILGQAVSSTTSSSATSSAATSFTMSSSPTSSTVAFTTAASNTAIGAAAASATSSATLTSDSYNNSNRALDLGLGIGLGVGIPLLLLLFGLCAFLAIRRRRKRRQSRLPRGSRPQSMARNMSMAQVSERASDSPLVPLPPVFPHPTSPRHSGGTPRPRSSYAPSRFSTAGSRASSFFEPFEFERPGSQDFDTRSVMSAMSGTRVSTRGLQRINEDELSEMPTTPQWPLPAHQLQRSNE